ncbi:unnamed protein product [Gongylonema pulchrum]|uniref:Protein-serine/threonine kinase n=1 Tax=Gongylonema pulchrum TaxID=637853 RepID=A0A183EY97_9BILA|nr:unnamed protein product [Gongylonema pulchrum]
MRATIEHYGEFAKLPPVEVLATLGNEDLTIRLSDTGGGISRNAIDQIFRYTYTTAPPPDMAGYNAPLAGLGYGLPLSRLYARYFHGDLTVISMEGYGTEAFLYVKALPYKASEKLPTYSTSSHRNLTMSRQAADWAYGFPDTHDKNK